MRLSTSTNIFDAIPGERRKKESRMKLSDSLRICKESGFSVLDMNFCDNGFPKGFLLSDQWEEETEKILEESQKLGIEFSQSHLEFYNVCDKNIENREIREELVRRGIIASGKLKAKWAVLHLGTVYTDGAYREKESKKENMEYIKPYLELAAVHGVGIAVENLPDKVRRRYCGSPEELIDFVDTIHAENLGICWDFGHGNLMKIDQATWLRKVGSRLKAVHVADNYGEWDEHMAPFYGNICWEEMMRTLKEIDYSYDLTYEIHNMTKNLPVDLRKKQLAHLVDIGEYLLSLYNGS